MATTMLEPSPEATRAGAVRDKRSVGRLAGIVERLSHSEMFKDYERAFSETTKLPLAIRSLETWNLSMAGKPRENPFCELMAQCNRTCAACLEVQERIANENAIGPITVTCFAGLCETAVPVRVGERIRDNGRDAATRRNNTYFFTPRIAFFATLATRNLGVAPQHPASTRLCSCWSRRCSAAAGCSFSGHASETAC